MKPYLIKNVTWTLLTGFVLLTSPIFCLGNRIQKKIKQIDSLHTIYLKTTDIEQQIDLLNQISQLQRDKSDLDTAINYAQQAYQKAKESGYKIGEAEALRQHGAAECIKGNSEKAEELLQQSAQVAKKSHNQAGLGKAYNEIGTNFNVQGNNLRALEYHEKALAIFEKLDDDAHIGYSASLLASIHNILGNFTEALQYLPIALEKFKKINKTDRITNILINMGLLNSDAGNLKQAQNYFEEASIFSKSLQDYRFDCTIYQNLGHIKDKEEKLDSASYYYTKALNISIEHQDSLFISHAYYNLAKVTWKSRDAEKTLQILDSTENTTDALFKASMQNLIWIFKAQIYNFTKDYTKARDYGEKSLAHHKLTGEKRNLVSNYEILALIYENLKDYKAALTNYKQYSIYKDSLNQNDISKMIMKYDFEKKENEIKSEQKEVLAQKALEANTTYGVLGAVILLTGLGLYTYWIRNKKLRLEKQNIDLRRREAELAKDAEEFKSRFLSNISHEFRTPLTLINGHIEILKTEIDSKYLKRLKEMDYSSKRLLQLINQLLDLTKIESGKYTLYYKKGNLLQETVTYVQAFHSLAQENQVDLLVNVTYAAKRKFEQQDFAYSSDALGSIFNNLLSNALKYTPAGGKIEVSIDVVGGRLYLQFKDNGSGINPKDLPNKFYRFHQSQQHDKAAYEGSGIGLAIVKELVQIHGGEVQVENNAQGGCTFTVWVSSGEQQLSEHEETIAIATAAFDEIAPQDYPSDESSEDTEKPMVLVIEDQQELRRFIVENLQPKYRIIEAENGQLGIDMAREHMPDIIISDVMMPKMSGFELTKLLKEHEITSHIPIVLLTAKASLEDKLEGLQVGADDYLTKPFSIAELELRIQNRFRQQKSLRHKLAQDPLGLEKDDTDELNAVDRAFIEKLNNLVHKNLGQQIDVTFLASEIGLSNSQLTRKLKVLIGVTPANFIRHIQLHFALDMLKEGHPVAQACWKAGFTDPTYFSKIFKKQFGFLPSDKERI